jgi:hypothetical protein
MNDSLDVIVRVFSILLVPLMLVLPLVIVLLTPQRSSEPSKQVLARSRTLGLAVGTALALALWLGALLASRHMHGGALRTAVDFAWVLFFPLWFGLGVPAVRARNPIWGGALHGEFDSGGAMRTASLVPRGKDHPIRRGSWMFVATALLGLFAAIAARGLRPFGEDVSGQAERTRWLLSLMMFAPIVLGTFAIVPWSLRRANEEPEPLDAGGSEELRQMYRAQRLRKVRGMFWLLGFVLPAFLGGLMAASVWWPKRGTELGLVGGLGGAGIGLAGAAFGCWMAYQRVRIAEAKAKLDASDGARA